MTILDWLNKFEQPIQARMLDSTLHVDRMRDAVGKGFNWDETTEGNTFWYTVYGELKHNNS